LLPWLLYRSVDTKVDMRAEELVLAQRSYNLADMKVVELELVSYSSIGMMAVELLLMLCSLIVVVDYKNRNLLVFLLLFLAPRFFLYLLFIYRK